MPDGSIDLIVTDPPYYSTDLAFDKATKIDYKQWLIECVRILKPDGVLVSFADFNLLAELKSYKVFKSSYELIWEKTIPVGYLDANNRPLKNHEFIGVFTNQFKKSTYNPQKIEGKPYKQLSGKNSPIYGGHKKIYTINTGDRHPKSVLKYSRPNKSLHPTAKPVNLLEFLIKSYSNENDTIFDPFMGSGSTGVACKNTGRDFIGIELDNNYFDIAVKSLGE